jgi:predicted transcriptional regulator
MKVFALKVEDELAEGFVAAAAERELPVEDLIIGMAAWSLAEQDFMTREPYTPEQIAQIEEGLAAEERGELIPHEDVMAQLRERFPEETGRQIIERALESYAELLNYAADMPNLHEDWDTQVAKGLAAMEEGETSPQHEVFARWQAKYG